MMSTNQSDVTAFVDQNFSETFQGNKKESPTLANSFAYPEFKNDMFSESMQGDPEPILLQFRPWLAEQISSGKFLGLEWLDGNKKRIFKIPWTKMHHPNWQDHHEIFRAWSQYRGKFDNVDFEPTYSQTKSNFRTLLRKCADIEEMQGYHQMGLQTGNYKVYRILSQEEAREKRRNMKKPKKNTRQKYVDKDGQVVKQVTIKRSITVTAFPEGANSNKKYIVSRPSTCIAIPLPEGDKLDIDNLPEFASKILSKGPLMPVKKLSKKFLQAQANGDGVVLATSLKLNDAKSLQMANFKETSLNNLTAMPNNNSKNNKNSEFSDEKNFVENSDKKDTKVLDEANDPVEESNPTVEALKNLGVDVGSMPIKVEIEDCIFDPLPVPKLPKQEKKQKNAASTQNSKNKDASGNGAFELLLQAAKIAEERNIPPKSAPIIPSILIPKQAPEIFPPNPPDILLRPGPVILKREPKPLPSIVDVLKELHIPPEELYCYVMHVRYETKQVMVNIVLSDMSYGYRLRYGKPGNNTTAPNGGPIIYDDDCTLITFPEVNVPTSNSLFTVLENMDAGLVVKADKSFTMHAKRLCLSRIFAFTSYGTQQNHNTEPMALVRDQGVVLFSYQEFLKDWHRFLVEGGTTYPNIEVNLAFGKKPKHRHSRVFVAVTLIPKAAESMMRKLNTDYSSKQTDTCFDNVLKLFE